MAKKANSDATFLRRTRMNVVFTPINNDNVERLRELNLQLFPIKYNLAFYDEVLTSPSGYAQLACVDDRAVGAICCRPEPLNGGNESLQRIYIMTFGVIESYRRAGIGSQLLANVIARSKQDKIVQIYLHVQTSNTAALNFYQSHGFESTELVRNYYKHIEPPDCYVLHKQLPRQHSTSL